MDLSYLKFALFCCNRAPGCIMQICFYMNAYTLMPACIYLDLYIYMYTCLYIHLLIYFLMCTCASICTYKATMGLGLAPSLRYHYLCVWACFFWVETEVNLTSACFLQEKSWKASFLHRAR